ncbi:translation factor SUA5 [Geosporobacter subterraneus DSM 17957]|uniref:Threonylcarbamoyl-AMP synthase n=1 Tax=Geosporobacter subterraneus DSM 17957 TaxID=1121919 RepID=A0A1M6QHY9_9FIRM|nr:L-threonylcarbamoyladenylate synthase [Geosporobacter subterraneus]SHK19816.1 translation factor SUA5 [Geosporobacter subterraneus DSM 17957]
METKIISIDPSCIDQEKLQEAANILKRGGTVAFPTETVYGLGANALDQEAVVKIFRAKGRPSDNPLIVHIADFDDINPLVREIPAVAKKLADRFWPGPLTMIFPKSEHVPEGITAGLDTVAIRMPSHGIARALIKLSGVPVAAPSANLSGKPSPTKAAHVIEDLMGKVEMIISGGECVVGLESTVLDISGEVPAILRPGGITLEDLKQVLEAVIVDPALEEKMGTGIVPKSPGMKYTHYAPKAEMMIIDGAAEIVVTKIENLAKEKEKDGLKVGIMATEETKDSYGAACVLSMGSRKAPETIGAKLFDTLRHFDALGVDLILAEGISRQGVGHAVMNRMLKAAGYRILSL